MYADERGLSLHAAVRHGAKECQRLEQLRRQRSLIAWRRWYGVA